jgi:hypothetical protein
MADVAIRKIIRLDVQSDIAASTKSAADSLTKLNRSLATVKVALASVFAVDRILAFSRSIVSAALSFEALKGGLVAVTGSAAAADAVFAKISAAAVVLPATVTELTESFVKLSRFGIAPTIEQLGQYSLFAAGLNKSLDQFTEAIIDAQGSQFERLKEFGIRVRDLGSELEVTFAGQTKVIGDNATELNKHLNTLTAEFKSAALPLSVAISGITDSWQKLTNTVVAGGLTEELTRTATILGQLTQGQDAPAKAIGELLTGFVKGLNDLMQTFSGSGQELLETLHQIEGALSGSLAGAVIGFLIGGPAGAAAFGFAGAVAGSAVGDQMLQTLDEQIKAVAARIIDLSGEIERAATRIGFPQAKLADMVAQLHRLEDELAALQEMKDRLTGSAPSQSFPLTVIPGAVSPGARSSVGSSARPVARPDVGLADWQQRLADAMPERKASDVERLAEGWATAAGAFDSYAIQIRGALPEMTDLQKVTEGLTLAASELAAMGNPFAGLLDGFAQMAQGIEMLKQSPADVTDAYVKMGTGIAGVLDYISETSQSLGIENATFQKALAISQAAVDGALAIIKVMATIPAPYNFAVAGAVAGMVGAQMAVIANQSIPEKRQFGGPVQGGQMYQVGEAGPELFTDRYGKNYMIPAGGGSVTPNTGAKVTINNYTKAEVKTEEQSDGTVLVHIIDTAVRAAKKSLMTDLTSGQGDINKVMQRTYGLRRSV